MPRDGWGCGGYTDKARPLPGLTLPVPGKEGTAREQTGPSVSKKADWAACFLPLFLPLKAMGLTGLRGLRGLGEGLSEALTVAETGVTRSCLGEGAVPQKCSDRTQS